MDAAEQTAIGALVYTAVMTGLRQAELLGLRWQDLARLFLSVRLCLCFPRRRRLLMASPRLCACGCGESLEGGRPNRRFFSDACRVRHLRCQRGIETVTSEAGGSYHTKGLSTERRAPESDGADTLSAFDRKQAEALRQSRDRGYCCLFHLALAQDWPYSMPNPWREDSYLERLRADRC
jgi:hypothetical protein